VSFAWRAVRDLRPDAAAGVSGSGDRSRVSRVFSDPKRSADYAVRRFPAGRARREERAFRRLVALLEHGRQLDAPCGAGRLGRALSAAGPVVGLDSSAAMLHGAAAAGGYRLLVHGDAFRLPFRDGAFAGAACVRLLHHLGAADRRAVLVELRRVCSGPFVVSYFDAATLQALRARRKRERKGSRKAIRRAEFLEDLAAAGLAARAFSRPLPWIAEQTLVAIARV
jgi:ubiquinone/menaquinone biosynthesis C-methylase UbiE